MKTVESMGSAVLNSLEQTGRTFLLLLIIAIRIVQPPYQFYPIVRQIYFIGARSLSVIVISGLTIGMVLGLQFYNTLERFGSVDLLGSAVALSVLRELGPVMTALMVVGRAGSAICAELGIMRISEQVDALECMAISPDKFLVAPKLVAGIISVPLLTCVFSLVAIFGGYFVGVVLFGVGEGSYINGMIDAVVWGDVRLGLVKSLIFGLLVTLICCSKGFYIHLTRSGSLGAEGVSYVTTDAVVISSIAVLFSDFLIGAIL
ncbi:MAG: MlaE family lipid ABC transporter permease subunit [Gammaproteobacteria bacterium]|jgi:phospholipid/cholesterol/gamma-HCH transport system permease protein